MLRPDRGERIYVNEANITGLVNGADFKDFIDQAAKFPDPADDIEAAQLALERVKVSATVFRPENRWVHDYNLGRGVSKTVEVKKRAYSQTVEAGATFRMSGMHFFRRALLSVEDGLTPSQPKSQERVWLRAAGLICFNEAVQDIGGTNIERVAFLSGDPEQGLALQTFPINHNFYRSDGASGIGVLPRKLMFDAPRYST